ncbi:MAG: hypothetical protein H0X35_15105, partial [Pseudonocardiales bacterium]|nr:hypothetical protein [Pseudonocardiales bacterium]
MLTDEDAARPAARAPVDPLDLLSIPPRGWRARVDELTGGLALWPSVGSARRVLAAIAVVAVVGLLALVGVVLVARGSGG